MLDMELVKKRVIEITIEVTGEGEFPEPAEVDARLEEPLDEWGVDSLSALELAVHLERQFGTRLEEDELTGVRSLADIVKLVEEKGKV
ncbi:acyl carrier protein [Xylanibacillus composti]|uniref:Carrier domain-containing protein n=1 Tax=Xylanibacillus composti TaxID=1572762 RepID=A0A8J4M4N0_9BACL|nr:acyl carrier protein [Xylanibacillus composti]GIQ71467.1 hypothetical protein XYCOK13_42910 [Xylanibacillus composti]